MKDGIIKIKKWNVPDEHMYQIRTPYGAPLWAKKEGVLPFLLEWPEDFLKLSLEQLNQEEQREITIGLEGAKKKYQIVQV